MSNLVDSPITQLPLIVGIGASHGGLEAIQSILRSLRDDAPLVLIVVHHSLEENLASFCEALSRASKLPIESVVGETHIEPARVYVAPSHLSLRLDGNVLRTEQLPRSNRHTPIDQLFGALAEYKERAVGIILSGGGSDGALGLKRISDAGGMTIIQSPESAEAPSMPECAAAMGIVDYVLPPNEIAFELLRHGEQAAGAEDSNGQTTLARQIIAAIPRIASAIEKQTENDFKHYKTTTLTRRIRRRIQVLKIQSVDAYVELLNNSREEALRLFRELLISVTEFFRDPEAFDSLSRDVISKLIAGHGANDTLRVWVAGCATGEEAYSLAIAFLEEMETAGLSIPLQIFATDLDDRALEIARAGSYPIGIQDQVTPSRIRKFFTKRSNRYFINKSVRDSIVFTGHNLISDPPFTKQDMIVCRNLLIYLGSHLQKKLIPLFHYSLRPGGFLFLGPSESMTGSQELFIPISAKHRIYQRKSAALGRPGLGDMPNIQLSKLSSPDDPKHSEVDLFQLGQRISLDEFAPQWAIVDDNLQVYALSSNTSDFLQFTAGAFKNNIVSLAHSGLKIGLRAAFAEAKKTRRRVVSEHLSVPVDGGIQRVNITVQPMPEVGQDSSLHYVAFQKNGEPIRLDDLPAEPRKVDAISYEKARALIEQLEGELMATRSDLERTVQELEAANEELKSSNEELLSMNEELQSANEELESSKEELQQVNDSLANANSDLENLLQSTNIATIFVDKELRIRSFTPAATTVYSLIESDIGRPLEDLRHRAVSMPPIPALEQIASEDKVVEETVEFDGGRWMIRRLLPYKTRHQTADGIVMTFADVTDLRTEQQRLEMALRAGNLGVWDLDLRSDSAWRSPQHDAVFGYDSPVEHWNFDTFLKHVYAEDVDSVNEFFSHASSQNDWNLECRIIRTDGQMRWVHIIAQNSFDETGRAVRMFGTVADITERKRDAERIANSEAHLRCIIDNMATFLGVLDLSGNVIEANHAALESGGLSREDVIGKPFWECYWWSYDHAIQDQLKDSIDKALTGKLIRYDVQVRMKDESYIIIDFMLAPAFDEDGRVTFLIPSGIDITDRKKFLSAVEASEERFRTLADNISQFAWIAEPNGDLTWYNQRWFDYTGSTLEEMKGWGWRIVQHPDHCERVSVKYKKSLADQTEWEDTFPLRRHDGEYRWFLSRMIPIRDQFGNVVRYFGTNTDITDHKRTEEELVHARRLAEAANQAKSDFLANMSHEIRSPMTAILGFADLLNVDSDSEREKVETIRRNGQFLLQLVNDILDLSKIEAGKVTVDAVKFDPTLMLEEVCSLMSVRAAESGLELNVEYGRDIPRSVTTDPVRLRQVLINLVGNAIKFTEEGEVTLRLSYQIEDQKLRFDIIDTGIGISEHQQRKLFRPFEQADASIVRKYGGSGLGLAISERLAELLNGHIEVRSKVGQGSTFSLLIGCDPSTEITDASAKPTTMVNGSANGQVSVDFGKRDGQVGSGLLCRRILIVDDRRDIRFLTQHFVQQLGGDVLLAENGIAALDLIDKERSAERTIDIVLMDVQMPEMDGFTTVRTLREKGFGQPIIALTANAMQSDRDACFAAGYTDYLSKPIDIQKLADMLRKYAAD